MVFIRRRYRRCTQVAIRSTALRYSGAFSIVDPEIAFKLIQQKSIKNFQFPTVTLNLVSSTEEFGTLIYLETNNSLRILLSINEGRKASARLRQDEVYEI